jgi:hypothetical protein
MPVPDTTSQPSPQPSPPADGKCPPVVVLVRDLMFAGRIGATARAAGVALKLIRDPAALAGSNGRLLIVDLNQPGALEAAVVWKGASSAAVVGFVSHVDAETIARARLAGIDRILPRSQFVNVLDELLAS